MIDLTESKVYSIYDERLNSLFRIFNKPLEVIPINFNREDISKTN